MFKGLEGPLTTIAFGVDMFTNLIRSTRGQMRLVLLAGLTALAGAGIWAIASAQQAGQSPSPNSAARSTIQEIQQARAELEDLRNQLETIQENVVKKNPAIQDAQANLQDLLMEKMTSEDLKPQQAMERMQDLESKLEAGDMEQAEKQETQKSLRSIRSALMEAQKQALEDPEVKQARQDLSQDLLAAMKDQNPKTEQIIQEMRSTQQRMQQLIQQAQSQMGQQGGQSGQMPQPAP